MPVMTACADRWSQELAQLVMHMHHESSTVGSEYLSVLNGGDAVVLGIRVRDIAESSAYKGDAGISAHHASTLSTASQDQALMAESRISDSQRASDASDTAVIAVVFIYYLDTFLLFFFIISVPNS